MDYEEKSVWTFGENEPKTNPIKPKQSQFKANFKRAKMDVNFYSIKDYENERLFRPAGKQTQSKPISKAKKCCCV